MSRAITAFVLAIVALFAINSAVAQSSMWVTAYYPSWAWSNGYTDTEVPWSALTHVVYFSANPSDTYPYFDSTYASYSWVPTLVSAAKSHGVKIILCVGGVWGTGATYMDSIAVDSAKTYTFAQNACDFAYRNGFQGIDIDWETNMGNQDAHDRMLRAFHYYLTQWPTQGLLTIAETQAAGSTYGYRASAINAYVDMANMMNYDLGQGQTAGFNAGLHVPNYSNYTSWTWDDHGPKQLLDIGVSASKTACGIPLYGRGDFTVTKPGDTKTSYYSPYYNFDVLQKYITDSTYHWDATALVPWLSNASGFSGTSGVTFISYDDSASVAAKVAYAKTLGLGGVMMYDLRAGWLSSKSTVAERNPLVTSVWKAIGNTTTDTTSASTTLSAPTLTSPAYGATGQALSIALSWSAVTNASSYHVQVARNSSFSNLTVDDSSLTTATYTLSSLLSGTTYYWKVQAKSSSAVSSYSSVYSFTTVTTSSTTSDYQVIPGTISGTSFDASSSSNAAITDSSKAVGFASTGDYAIYDVNVLTSGNYTATFVVANKSTSGTFTLVDASGTTLLSKSVPNTGSWYKTTTVTGTVTLSAGEQTLKFVQATCAVDLYSMAFTSASSVISGVKDNGFNGVQGYALAQNYPNPFNPSTQIRYQVPVAAHVTLSVYNMIGQEVCKLVDQTQEAGVHEVVFDARQLSSGMYIYRLNSGSASVARRMVLMK